ncbi:hypothetical protein C8Q78DRAFT_1080946 [Trametes maxima]|nr:hypothetical protein C8Q78DRAFT_1080946 [Trametes maxima]
MPMLILTRLPTPTLPPHHHSADPSTKYTPYPPLPNPPPARHWPARRLTRAPIWLSTDLRDGNQALARPMSPAQKRAFFRHLVRCGFKEIEVAFPAASDAEFSFVRGLVEGDEVPGDVWIQVLTPARAELVHRTFAAIAGARNVILMLFHAAAPCFRTLVFGKTKPELVALATAHTRLVRALADEHARRYGTRFRLLYGVEAFSQTEPEFVVEICEAVREAWGRAGTTFEEKIMFNLPSTVEIAPPNHYADQIEYFCTHMKNRDEIIVSLHTHNDRGTAVAASELGLLAGADRVEGCLFGNGERSGNVDLVTLALNLYTQGVPCGLDFSALADTVALYTRCTALPVHPRHPYAGELVFTAFSGSHQDGIKKGLEARAKAIEAAANCEGGDNDNDDVARARAQAQKWTVPYLPLDPADVGRVYEAVIRVNAQSGKGGVAYVLRACLDVDLPRGVQQEFARVVQGRADADGREVSAEELVEVFVDFYHIEGAVTAGGRETRGKARVVLGTCAVVRAERAEREVVAFQGRISVDGQSFTLKGEGATPLEAFLAAVESRTGLRFAAIETYRHASLDSTSADMFSFVQLVETGLEDVVTTNDHSHTQDFTWGVGVDIDKDRSLIRAAVSAMNNHLGARPLSLSGDETKEVLRVLHDDYALPLPVAMHDAVGDICTEGDAVGLAPEQIAAGFVARFCHTPGGSLGTALLSFSISRARTAPALRLLAAVLLHGTEKEVEGSGGDALECLLSGIAGDVGLLTVRAVHVEARHGAAKGSRHVAFVQLETDGKEVAWGVGLDDDMTTATLQAALVAAANCGQDRRR